MTTPFDPSKLFIDSLTLKVIWNTPYCAFDCQLVMTAVMHLTGSAFRGQFDQDNSWNVDCSFSGFISFLKRIWSVCLLFHENYQYNTINN